MRTHGWGGATPASDEEAIERILDAASAAIDERGAAMRVADVARALEVSRQTVYNYFPGNSLLEAVATRSGVRFIERLAAHLKGITDPVDALVESFAFTLEWLPNDKPVQLMLANDFGRTSTEVTSDMAKQFGHGILAGLDVDWAALGMDDAAIDDLVEYMLRLLQSFMIDPGRPPRSGEALRGYVRRWLGPVVTAEIARHRP
ncbi:TetR/AcrR family transcriptional regulator [Mycolicibacterium confluentis]|uniref:TetR family transcriptional regulator n=1 Tax=Mycolicibacterium confluentis TaxID=28047 RepID=A0A7I7XUJ5_9MYCO|nr:TetR/AcrR family transcriptional regulator [Mycolicibacterium confluentis]MCV7322159.1 TetR/AcrR family transcriptional regulator [Mycolicibacterium confluentis]ORV31520.1 TetR family transcriptional regulator [Mycolicibacterium confluentis]BBZ32946.1 TetR family transcriptional regulator [Mycolicibacterium confluentis]